MASKDDMIHDRVSESDLAESREMLKTRVGQVNAVFACFGSAAQNAQEFEAALAKFLSEYNRLSKRTLALQDLEGLDHKLQKKTLGMLLREFSKHVKISDPKVGAFLEMALTKRNFLMHHFFREKRFTLRSQEDRMELISELVGIERLLSQAATLIRAMGIALSEEVLNKRKPCADSTKVLFTADIAMPDDP
jgi:hypothetical protein